MTLRWPGLTPRSSFRMPPSDASYPVRARASAGFLRAREKICPWSANGLSESCPLRTTTNRQHKKSLSTIGVGSECGGRTRVLSITALEPTAEVASSRRNSVSYCIIWCINCSITCCRMAVLTLPPYRFNGPTVFYSSDDAGCDLPLQACPGPGRGLWHTVARGAPCASRSHR